MAGKLVTFRGSMPSRALELIRQLEQWPLGLSSQARRQMSKRNVSWPQIRQAIKTGRAADGPYQDQRGDWLCRLQVCAAGKNVAVLVKMENGAKLKAVTAIVSN